MKIRNDNPDGRLMPLQHLHAEPGEEITWPNDLPVPGGFTVTEAPPASPANPSKAELVARATALGVEIPKKATKDQIADAIEAATLTHPPSADEEGAATDQEQ